MRWTRSFQPTNRTDEISIEQCRELLGDEADRTCDDDEIDRIRRCAEPLRGRDRDVPRREASDDPLAHEHELASATSDGSKLPDDGRRSDLRARQHQGADREPESADPAEGLRGILRSARASTSLARFREEGESAKTADRTELQKLLQFCRTNKGRVQFVVVFNLTRFARDKYDHFALRAHLKSLGISLRSATEPIDDTSTGKLMEGVLAAFAQFDNDVRSERTRGGMKAALELGRWTFLAPLGYLNAHRSTGRSLIPDPERASLVRRAFQDFATGTFHEARGPQERQRPRPDDEARQAGPVADVRRHAAEPRLHRPDRRP